MQRVTISLDDELLEVLDRFAEARGYAGRSEAVRDLVRGGLQQAQSDRIEARECIAALMYVYDHRARELAGRLMDNFHGHHDLALATLHVHLDHDSCLEVTMLKGPTPEVQKIADRVIAERGVRYGRAVMIPVEIEPGRHAHAHDAGRPYSHLHIKPAR